MTNKQTTKTPKKKNQDALAANLRMNLLRRKQVKKNAKKES
jgi:hypothetical protein